LIFADQERGKSDASPGQLRGKSGSTGNLEGSIYGFPTGYLCGIYSLSMGEMRNFMHEKIVFSLKNPLMRVRCKKKMASFGVLKYFFKKDRNNCSIKIRKGWYEPPDDLFDIVMSNSRKLEDSGFQTLIN
jgi:hypothetical protein